jgi:hypothetical protein
MIVLFLDLAFVATKERARVSRSPTMGTSQLRYRSAITATSNFE